MEPNIPEWNSVIGWVGLLRLDSIWKILQVNAVVWGGYSSPSACYDSTVKLYFLLCWAVLDKNPLLFFALLICFLDICLKSSRCYDVTNFVLAIAVLEARAGWRRTPLLTQCLESQNNIQTFLTNKSIFLTQRKTIFWWPYHRDLWVCLVQASFIFISLCRLQIKSGNWCGWLWFGASLIWMVGMDSMIKSLTR